MPFMVSFLSASDTNNVKLNAKADELRGLAPKWCYRMTTFDYKIAIIFKMVRRKIDNEYRKGVFDHLTSKNDKTIVMEGLFRVLF